MCIWFAALLILLQANGLHVYCFINLRCTQIYLAAKVTALTHAESDCLPVNLIAGITSSVPLTVMLNFSCFLNNVCVTQHQAQKKKNCSGTR